MLKAGTVKWFNDDKGFGFVLDDSDGTTEYFVHYTSIHAEGRKRLKEGQRVEFEPTDGAKGRYASNVRALAGT